MKTTQGWGWLAAGVLALGLNGFYQDGGAAWAHRAVDAAVERVAERAGAVSGLASEGVERLVEAAGRVTARDETASCPLTTAMARLLTRIARTRGGMARFEAISARHEAAVARVEAERARIEARVARVRLSPMAFNEIEIHRAVCPRLRVDVPRVNIPRVPMVEIPAPAVRVDMLNDGSI